MAISDLPFGPIGLNSILPFHNPTTGQDERTTVQQFARVVEDAIVAPGEFGTQYAAPAENAYSLQVEPSEVGRSTWLLITPASAFAAGSVVLPPVAECRDTQEILVTSAGAVTALTVSGNGTSVNGAPTTLAANGFFRLRFDGVFQAWYRVG